MGNLKLSGIYIYPVKSLRGIAVAETELTPRGPRWDRRWMLVDGQGDFLSQRELPRMALLQPALEGDRMRIRDLRGRRPDLLLPVRAEGARRTVTVWDDACTALRVSAEADRWFSAALGRACSLVYMPEDSLRPVDPDYAKAGEVVSFADGFPYLIIGEAALAALNARLEHPIEMLRFRPNLVFSGGVPFEEDHWATFSIGGAHFRGTKPCARCQVPTIDLQTAEPSREPTRTLARFRREGNKILFGLNACWEPRSNGGAGIIRVGDAIVT